MVRNRWGMIFRDVPLNSWLLKYPNLKVKNEKCWLCGSESPADKPFIEKDWVGLAQKCSCGAKPKYVVVTSTPRNNEAIVPYAHGPFDEIKEIRRKLCSKDI